MSAESQIASLLKSGKENITDQINEIVANTQPKEGFNTLAEDGNPSSKLLTIALQAGTLVDLLNSNISGDLNPVQVIILANFGLQQGWFESFMTSKKMEGKEIDMNASVPGQNLLTLLDKASNNNYLGDFIKYANGTVDLGKLVDTGKAPIAGIRKVGPYKGKVSVASKLLATNAFTVEIQEKLNGVVNIGDSAEGHLYIYHAIQGGGSPQWEALTNSGKLAGMLENFNALVPLGYHEAPLVYVLAQNNILDKVLGDLASKDMLEWKPDIDGDGTERGADAKKVRHFENELDLGAKTWPGTQKKQMLQISDGDPEAVTPLFIYQVPADSNLIGTMAAHGKLVMNLSGDVFGTAVSYMLETDFVKSGNVWFKTVIYTHQENAPEGAEMLEVAALVYGGPKESKYPGKLVHGCMPKNILKGCLEACKGSPVKSPNSEGEMTVDPSAASTFYWLKPFMAADAQLVDKQYLMEHGMREEPAAMVIGEHLAEDEICEYWS